MSESDEAIEVDDADIDFGNIIEVDLDAETEEEAEPADSDGETDEDPQEPSDGEEVEHPEDEEDAETPTQEPFSFRAHGTEFDVPGAVVSELDDGEGGKEDWIAMPRSAFQESVQPHLADLSAVRRQEETLKRQVSDLDPTKNPSVIEAMSLIEGWKGVMDLDTDAQMAWMENGKENFERLKLEAENKALRESREASPEPDHSEFVSQVEADVPLQVTEAMARVKVELPRSAQKEVSDRLWGRIQRGENIYIVGDGNNGVEPGELGVHLDVIEEAVQDAVGRREAGALKAEAVNAPKKKGPRQVAAKGSQAPAKDTKTYGPEDADAWRRDMGLDH